MADPLSDDVRGLEREGSGFSVQDSGFRVQASGVCTIFLPRGFASQRNWVDCDEGCV